MEIDNLQTYAIKEAEKYWNDFKERYLASNIKKKADYSAVDQMDGLQNKSCETNTKQETNNNKQDVKPAKKRWFPWMKVSPEEQERKNEAKRIEIIKTIKEFCENNSTSTYDYPSDLTPNDRRIVHEVAEEFNLKHESVGKGKKRHICLEKKTGSIQKALPSNPVQSAIMSNSNQDSYPKKTEECMPQKAKRNNNKVASSSMTSGYKNKAKVQKRNNQDIYD